MFSLQSDFLPDSDRHSVYLPHIIANNLMSKETEKVQPFSHPISSDRLPHISANDKNEPQILNKPNFMVRKRKDDMRANKENTTYAA